MLWPFALKYVNYLHNYLSLNDKGLCPFERFTSTSVLNDLDISDFHTFGSPCYVYNAQQHIPKWEPKST